MTALPLTDCLVVPPAAVEVAPDLLRLAADALEGDADGTETTKARAALEARREARARALVRAIDWTAFEWFWSEGGFEWARRHDKATHVRFAGPRVSRAVPKAVLLEVATRDQWTCRYCGLRVVSPRFLAALHKRLPAALPVGDRDVDTHPAYVVLRWSFDHLVPHAAGGTNEPDNLVSSCGGCNFNKGDCTLDELRLTDPFTRARSSSPSTVWDGLSTRLGSAPI